MAQSSSPHPSTPAESVMKAVGGVRTRLRLLLAQQGFCAGLTFAAFASLLLVAATKLEWWTSAVDYVWAVLLIGGIAGLLAGWFRRVTPLVAAQLADERAGLQERLSTAVELSRLPQRSGAAEAQLIDAARHAGELRPAEVLPWRPPRQLRALAAALACLLAAIYLPELPVFHSQQERADREVMRREGAALQKVAKEIEKRTARRDDENAAVLRRIAENMKQLGKDQARNRISKKSAMLRMNDLQKQLQQAQEQTADGAGRKSLEKVADALKRAADERARRGDSEGARALQQMAEKLSRKDMEGAGKQLEQAAKKLQSGELSPREAAKAADLLEEMAKSMEGSELAKASDQLKDAAKQLRDAAEKARQLQQQMASAKSDAERRQLQEQMKQAMSQGQQQASEGCQQAGGT